MSSTLISMESIKIREGRQRSKVDVSIEDLMLSLEKRGLLNPLIVEQDAEGTWLIAGERRLTSARKLGPRFPSYPNIEVKFKNDLDILEKEAIELDENIRREDLPWQDICRAVNRYHDHARERFSTWTQEKTAESIGLSQSHVQRYLTVFPELADTRVGGAATLITAFQQAERIRERKEERQTTQLLETVNNLFAEKVVKPAAPAASGEPEPAPPVFNAEDVAAQHILIANANEWLKTYDGSSFNFIHCDFPYGINFQDSDQGGAGARPLYEDSPDIYFALLNSLVQNLHKIAADNTILMFWYSRNFYDQTRRIFTAANGQVLPNDLIWHKSDNKGILPDPSRYPRHIYESAMMVRFGDPKIIKPKSDVYSAPTVREGEAHASEKPQPMLEHFFEMFVDEYTRMLDPTCGSGASIRAAVKLKADRAIGLELNPDFAQAARWRLAKQISLARASRIMELK